MSEQSNSKVGQKYGKKKVDNLWDTMPSQKPYQTVKYPAYQQHFARRKLKMWQVQSIHTIFIITRTKHRQTTQKASKGRYVMRTMNVASMVPNRKINQHH